MFTDLFVHWLVCGHLDLPQCLATMNKVAMNVLCVNVCFLRSFSLFCFWEEVSWCSPGCVVTRLILGTRWLACKASVENRYLTSRGTITGLFKVAFRVTFLSATLRLWMAALPHMMLAVISSSYPKGWEAFSIIKLKNNSLQGQLKKCVFSYEFGKWMWEFIFIWDSTHLLNTCWTRHFMGLVLFIFIIFNLCVCV